jgi:hypothetical protein
MRNATPTAPPVKPEPDVPDPVGPAPLDPDMPPDPFTEPEPTPEPEPSGPGLPDEPRPVGLISAQPLVEFRGNTFTTRPEHCCWSSLT